MEKQGPRSHSRSRLSPDDADLEAERQADFSARSTAQSELRIPLSENTYQMDRLLLPYCCRSVSVIDRSFHRFLHFACKSR